MTHKDMFKFLYLERLCKLYAKLMKNYDAVHVYENDGIVYVKWFKQKSLTDAVGKISNIKNFTEREFPVSHLSKKIVSYKNKVRRELKHRHDA